MQNAQEIYLSIRTWPPSERLRLAALILDDLAQTAEDRSEHQYALDLLDKLPGGRIFKTSVDVDEYLREERASWDR